MDKRLIAGVTAYLALVFVISLSAQLAPEYLGVSDRWAGSASMNLLTVPVALWLALRVGRMGRASLFLESLVVTVAAWLCVIYPLGAIAAPAGGSVDASAALRPPAWVWLAIDLLVPQLWLTVMSRGMVDPPGGPVSLHDRR